MIKALIREFPVTDILDDMTEEKIRKYAYTKDEVDALIAEAVAEARRIDEASMAKHNRDFHSYLYDSWIHSTCIVC